MSEDKVLALILKTLQNITDESMFSLASDAELGQIIVSKKGTPEAEAALVQITVRRLLGQIDHLQSGVKKAAQSSLSEVMKQLPRSSLALSKSDVAEMAKNIAGRSAAPANADKKAR